ncbi:PRC-barrel domain-containing protein [Nocardia jejuensis]|uniref:PRC-barrel domain-containing protein n=1 Tax=Nocardia jejuensis TaxID=328049 RepID=UPI000835BD5E|nr:PRC-barrel domain-containing protein [Nocardia jejuensis]
MAKTLESLIGCTVRDISGAEIGQVEGFYIDNESGTATWAAVSVTMAGDQALTPLAGAQYQPEDNSLRVRVDRDQVRGAPYVEHDGRLEPQAERDLLTYYDSGQRRGNAMTVDPRIRNAADEPMTYGRAGAESLLNSEREPFVPGTARTERIANERGGTDETYRGA